jgi:hypothetical protein
MNILEDKAFTNLYREYCSVKKVDMDSQEFLILVVLFAGYSVAIADQNFDLNEKQLIGQFTYNILEEIYHDNLTEENYNLLIVAYYEQLDDIAKEMDFWERKFMDTLKIICDKSTNNLKDSIIQFVEDVSKVSEGESDIEIQVINKIKHTL